MKWDTGNKGRPAGVGTGRPSLVVSGSAALGIGRRSDTVTGAARDVSLKTGNESHPRQSGRLRFDEVPWCGAPRFLGIDDRALRNVRSIRPARALSLGVQSGRPSVKLIGIGKQSGTRRI
jgi:hypothetical protein